MIYGYARVSTKTQARDGNGLESQEEALRAAGATQIFNHWVMHIVRTIMCSNMMTDHFIIQTIPPAHLRSL